MKKIFILLIVLQGVILGAKLDKIEVNGQKIPLIFEQDSTLPIISMQLVFKNSGSIEDNQSAGLAKMSAKILNEGTKSLGAVGFAKELEKNALYLESNVGLETFVIEMSALKERFQRGVELIDDLLSEPNLTQESFKKVKVMMLGEIKQKESDFDYIAAINLKKILFKNTPNENPKLGTLNSLEKISLDDVKKFLKEHLILDNLIVVIGGDLSLKEAKEFSKRAIKSLKRGKNKELIKFSANKVPTVKKIIKDTKQAYIYFGSNYDLNVSSLEAYKAKVASFILGASGFGSRLMEEIRVKRGLAYSVYASINLNNSHSVFKGYLQTKLQSQDEAIKIVKEIIKEFVKNGATKEELDQAKKFILGSEPLRNETLNQRLTRAFMEYYKGFELGFTKKELQKIKALKLEELNEFIKLHDEINDLSFSIVTAK